jgi:hypothetical protein
MTALIRTGYVKEAYANWSRWMARCGHCRYGAAQLQRFQPHFECSTCGGITEVIWPSERMVAGVERLLMMRPDPSTRNWTPGETLSGLMWENGEHGIFDGLSEALGATPETVSCLLSATDNRIQVDLLPKRLPNQIPARHRLELDK